MESDVQTHMSFVRLDAHNQRPVHMPQQNAPTRHIVLLLPLAFFFYAVWQLWPHTLDDAYISFQYAKQWIAGNGWVFVPGQRVEGFSNPLWVLILSIGGKVGLPIVSLAKIFGVLCGGLSIILTYLLVAQWSDRASKKRASTSHSQLPFAPFLATSLLAIHPGFAYYAVAGLETALFTFLVLLGVFLHVRNIRQGTSSAKPYIPFALAAITRPEGPLFLIVLFVHRLWLRKRSTKQQSNPWKQELVPMLKACCVPAGYLLFRVVYYKDILPNTYYAKPGQISEKWGASLQYIKSFLVYHATTSSLEKNVLTLLTGTLALLLGLYAVFLLLRSGVMKATQDISAPLALFASGYSVFILYSGGDWMEHYRFFQPILPLLYIGVGLGFIGLAGTWRALSILLLTIGLLSHTEHASQFWSDLNRNRLIDHAHRSQNNVKMAHWLNKNLPKGASIVTDEIGAVGYFTHLNVMDQWGLVDKKVAKILYKAKFNPYGSRKDSAKRIRVQTSIAKELMRRKPDYILLDYQGSFPRNRPPIPQLINGLTMRQLQDAMKGQYTYVRAFSIMPSPPFKHFLLYKRNP